MSRAADFEFASHDSISDAVLASLADWGSRPALSVVSPDRPVQLISADDLRTGVYDVERLLRSWGVRQSVPVALFLENSADFVILLLALARIGAVVIPGKLDWRRMELAELFENADPQLVISEESHVEAVSPFLTGRAVAVRRAQGIALVQEPGKLPGEAEFPDNVASINYTYRGLGYPLGAMVTHRQYLHGARVLQDGLQAEAGEQMLYSIPMTHIFTLVGCILVPLLYGLTGVIARTIHPRLLFQAIHDLNIQHLTAVPEIYSLLLRAHGESPPPPRCGPLCPAEASCPANCSRVWGNTLGWRCCTGTASPSSRRSVGTPVVRRRRERSVPCATVSTVGSTRPIMPKAVRS